MRPVDWQISLPAIPAALPAARRFCWLFFADTAGLGVGLLIASELSTLAIRHDVAAFAIRVLRPEPGHGRIEVRDTSDGVWRRHLPPDDWDRPGLGLGLVFAVADRAGHESNSISGQLLWAEFSWNPGAHGKGMITDQQWDARTSPGQFPAGPAPAMASSAVGADGRRCGARPDEGGNP